MKIVAMPVIHYSVHVSGRVHTLWPAFNARSADAPDKSKLSARKLHAAGESVEQSRAKQTRGTHVDSRLESMNQDASYEDGLLPFERCAELLGY